MNIVQRETILSQTTRLQLIQGDLLDEQVDAIVNAANQHLIHGGGLAGAIIDRGGAQIQQESAQWVRQHGPVVHDKPAVTGAGDLPCRFVIHAVGPVWGSGDEDRKLSDTVRGSLSAADRLGLGSLSLSAISTGIFGFPKERAAKIILHSIWEYFLDMPHSGLTLVRIVIIDRQTVEAFMKAWDAQDFPPNGSHAEIQSV